MELLSNQEFAEIDNREGNSAESNSPLRHNPPENLAASISIVEIHPTLEAIADLTKSIQELKSESQSKCLICFKN